MDFDHSVDHGYKFVQIKQSVVKVNFKIRYLYTIVY